MNPRESGWISLHQKIIKITSQVKDNSISHYNLVHKISSDASSDENSRCEGSSVQGMEEARNDTSLAIGRDEEPKGMLFWKQKERGKWSTLPHL